jgi:hypothetical protein
MSRELARRIAEEQVARYPRSVKTEEAAAAKPRQSFISFERTDPDWLPIRDGSLHARFLDWRTAGCWREHGRWAIHPEHRDYVCALIPSDGAHWWHARLVHDPAVSHTPQVACANRSAPDYRWLSPPGLKGVAVWGLDHLEAGLFPPGMGKPGEIFVTEGIFDAYYFGLTGAAQLGPIASRQQVKTVLRKRPTRVTLAFDRDQPKFVRERALTLWWREGATCRGILPLPEYKDFGAQLMAGVVGWRDAYAV